MTKYYCKKCKTNHRMNSEIGQKHRGIKVEKPKRKKYSILLPDGKIYKTTSIHDYKYAVLRLHDYENLLYDNYTKTSYSKKWYVDLYDNKKDAEKRAKWFKESHQIEIKDVRLIEL